MASLVAIPTLEELAQNPARAGELPLQVLAALASRCVVVQAALANAQLAALVANAAVDAYLKAHAKEAK
jgi:hypothetical protein